MNQLEQTYEAMEWCIANKKSGTAAANLAADVGLVSQGGKARWPLINKSTVAWWVQNGPPEERIKQEILTPAEKQKMIQYLKDMSGIRKGLDRPQIRKYIRKVLVLRRQQLKEKAANGRKNPMYRTGAQPLSHAAKVCLADPTMGCERPSNEWFRKFYKEAEVDGLSGVAPPTDFVYPVFCANRLCAQSEPRLSTTPSDSTPARKQRPSCTSPT